MISMRIIKGYNDKEKAEKYIKDHAKVCEERYIYKESFDKPTYDQITEYNNILKPFILDKEAINVDINNYLKREDWKKISDIIYEILTDCSNSGENESKLKNIYIRLLVDLKYRFKELLMNRGLNVLYMGTPENYDFIALTVLGMLGIDILIVDLKGNEVYTCKNRFEIITGSNKEDINIDSLEVDSNNTKILEEDNVYKFRSYLDNVNKDIDTRKQGNKYRTINIEVLGVHDITEYEVMVTDLVNITNATGREIIILEGIDNPTYEETLIRDTERLVENRLKEIGFGDALINITNKITELVESKKLNVTATINYRKVIYTWFNRFIKVLYNTNETRVPLVIIWGGLKEREEEFIGMLMCLPIDIIHLSYKEKYRYKLDNSYETIKIGGDMDFSEFPKVITSTASTMAYKAERELDKILYTGNEGLYRSMQFKEIQPTLLKTTYDEIGILWGQDNKYRPEFSTVGNLVKTGVIFSKINGVDSRGDSYYLNKIKELTKKDTILYDNLPFTEYTKDSGVESLVRRVIFKNKIDFEEVRKSKSYNYGVYSDETQNLIFTKTEQLMELDWCNVEIKNIEYIILEVILKLPKEITKRLHGYNFTEVPPKIVIYSGDTQVCSLEDCITIMFLKLVGFDIVVYAPTGYRIIEQYIKQDQFNNIELGEYKFEMTDINADYTERKTKGLLGRLLGL